MPKKTNTVLTDLSPDTSAARLYGRCVKLTIGDMEIELKVMGDKAVAAAQRELLMTTLEGLGVNVKEDK